MVMMEELLECDHCEAHKQQAVAEEQIRFLAEGGAVRIYCHTCQRQTFWHFPLHHIDPRPAAVASDPLLETFQKLDREAVLAAMPHDPLLVDYDGAAMTHGEDKDWDWYG